MYQKGIVEEVSSVARYVIYKLKDTSKLKEVMTELSTHVDGESIVVGLGQGLLNDLGLKIPGMREFVPMKAGEIDIPRTEGDLWCWLRGEDRGDLIHQVRQLTELLAPTFEVMVITDAFKHGGGRDLTGYVDGTENPEGEDALEAAFSQEEGIENSSFVTVQLWQHDFKIFDRMSQGEKDESIGRRLSDNEEFDAPDSAHVKRTAQEDFDPEAFMLRRSMPWSDRENEGLNFVCFGKTFDAFEAQMHRMSGNEDGIRDAIFKFTMPLRGNYFWCPPMNESGLDLGQIQELSSFSDALVCPRRLSARRRLL
jgi:putative iron-dependent peroxidase